MRSTLLSVVLNIAAGVSALPQQLTNDIKLISAFPALSPQTFAQTPKFITPLPFKEAQAKFTATSSNTTIDESKKSSAQSLDSSKAAAAASSCTSPRYRTEWDSMSTSSRSSFINAVKCLMGRPASGNFPGSKSRYEDMVQLHQALTNSIHGNDIFLFWHRYYIWTFEDMLRQECAFTTDLPWFDETKYAGNYPASSIFTSAYFGSLTSGGCVTNSQFNNAQSNGVSVVNLDIGPGSSNQAHCLSRNYDSDSAGYTSTSYVSLCNSQVAYHDMAQCVEGGPHAYGHVGIGGVMNDIYGSPGDPVFHLHHAFIDRNFKTWQYANPTTRLGSAGAQGKDANGKTISLSYVLTMNGLRPNVKIGDVIDTKGSLLCYDYR